MDEPDLERDRTTAAQHMARVRSYESWFKKDRSTYFTMLSSMHDDLIGEYEGYSTAKEMRDQLKFVIKHVNFETWHARLGHIGQDRMTRLVRESLLGSLTNVNLPVCELCLASKAVRKPFGKAV
ncbi:hypothetical protein TB2_013022 [Malus domestica]